MRLSPKLVALLWSGAIVLVLVPGHTDATGEKQLRHVRGTTGYQVNGSTPFVPVFGRFDLPDDALAITQTQSNAELIMPDSSIVALGENTRVQVGAFDNAAAGPGSTIVLNGGSLRFDVRRPAGGQANYRFVTATSQIAVRGTIGLLSFIGGNTSVSCVVCAADSVSVTVGSQTFTLATGQTLTIGSTGGITTGATTQEALQTFTHAGINPGANGPATIGGAGGAGATGGIVAAAVGAAVVAGVAASGTGGVPARTPQPNVTASPSPTPSPKPTATTTPTASPHPSPTASPSPVPSATIPGTVNVTGKKRIVR